MGLQGVGFRYRNETATMCKVWVDELKDVETI